MIKEQGYPHTKPKAGAALNRRGSPAGEPIDWVRVEDVRKLEWSQPPRTLPAFKPPPPPEVSATRKPLAISFWGRVCVFHWCGRNVQYADRRPRVK